jgi:hypothetical protein
MADIFLAQAGTDKLFLLSGEITTTVKTSQSVSAIDTFCSDISPTTGGNTLWCGQQANKLYIQSGQFTSTLKDSSPVIAGESAQYAVTYDIYSDGDEVAIHGGAGQRDFFMRSGMTTSTIKTSLAASVFQFLGLSTNSTDCSVTDNDAGERRVVLASGQFTTTVKDSQTGPQTVSGPQYWATGYTANDMIGSHRSPSAKVFIHSGQVTSTIKDSIAWSDTHPAGAESSDINARLGITGVEPTVVRSVSKRKIMPFAAGKIVYGKLPSADHSTATVMVWQDINGNTYTPAIGDRFIITDYEITNATGANTCTLFEDLDAGNDNDAGEPIVTVEFSGQGTVNQSFTIPHATQKLANAAHDVHFISSAAGETTVLLHAFITRT